MFLPVSYFSAFLGAVNFVEPLARGVFNQGITAGALFDHDYLPLLGNPYLQFFKSRRPHILTS